MIDILQTPPILLLPVLYYTVLHNITQSGNVQVINTTNTDFVLQGAEYGNTYFVTVFTVNVVGEGTEKTKFLKGQKVHKQLISTTDCS